MSAPGSFAETVTPDHLALAINELPDYRVLAGSMGRCVLMGEPPASLRRPNGRLRDLDAIDTTLELDAPVPAESIGPFQLDLNLSKTFAPTAGGWGLYLPHEREPFYTVPEEFCRPVRRVVAWRPDCASTVLPAAIQAELIDAGPYFKNEEHVRQFRAFAATQPQLPPAVRQGIQEYRTAKWHADVHGAPSESLSRAEVAYRIAKLGYLRHTSEPVRNAVDRAVGPAIRRLRHTPEH